MRLIIVGSLQDQLSTASKIAINNGAHVTHAHDEETALKIIRAKGADLLMVDVLLNIEYLIGQLEKERISTPIVACGVGNDSDAAVAAIKAGAKEYIPLPPDPELIAAVLTAISTDEHEFIYRDRVMMKVVSLADQIAPSEASIMITGESGTGKEVMARYVHSKSRRAKKPFISVNCAAIPENLLESELFGHEKGHLPARLQDVLVNLKKLTEAHYFLMKSAKWMFVFRQNYYALSKNAKLTGLVARGR